MISYCYADQAAVQGASPSPIVSMIPLLVIFVIFYFLLIRPQQKKVKTHAKMVENLKKGDRIITSSGFYGTILNIGDKSLEIKLAENLKVKILKSAVSEILKSADENSNKSEEDLAVKP